VTLVSYLANFATRFEVKVVGDIPTGYVVNILYSVSVNYIYCIHFIITVVLITIYNKSLL